MPFSVSLAASSAAMIGRDGETRHLRVLLDRALTGAPTAVVVSGEAGIGKSRLLREFAGSVPPGEADVVTGRTIDLGTTPTPYGATVGLLRALAATRGADALWRAAGPGRASLLRLLPELRDQARGDATGPAAAADAASPAGMREAFVTLVETLAGERGLVLTVEDIQWADEGTLGLLSFLLTVAARGRLLVVMSWRDDQPRPRDPVRVFVREAERAGLIERIALDRLDAAAERTLAETLLGTDDPERVRRLRQQAEGVPFFMEELARCGNRPLPDSLRGMLLAGYARLGDDAAAIARVVSVAADTLDHALLEAAGGLSAGRLDAAVREAVQGGVLTVDGDRYGFRHALLRDAVRDELLPGERVRVHRSLAERLQVMAAADPDPQLQAALAHHWQGAHDRRRALIAAIAAMDGAKARFAFATAARFGELALELWDQVADPAEAAGLDRSLLLLRVGSLLRNAGRDDRALSTVDTALNDPGIPGDPVLHARLLRDKGQYLVNLGRPGAAELFRDALAVLDGHGVDDARLRAVLLNSLAGRHMVAGRVDEAIAVADAAWASAGRAGDMAQLSVAANVRGVAHAHRGAVDDSMRDFALAREHAHDPSAALRYYVNYSDTLTMLGRYREAVLIAQEGLEQAQALGVARTSGAILTQNMVEPLVELGEVARAEGLLAPTLDSSTFSVVRAYLTASRVRLLVWRGQHADAADLLREQRDRLELAAQTEVQVWYDLVEMDVAVAEAADDAPSAVRAVLRMLDDDHPVTLHTARILLQAAADVAGLRVRRSHDAAGIDAAAAAARIDRAWSALPASWRPAAWQAIVAALLHPDPTALRHAIALADSGDVPVAFGVITRLEAARVLAASRDRVAAAALLDEAALRARDLGHVPLQRSVQAFAAAAGLGAHAPGAPPVQSSDLTVRERQVLALVAEGLTNRQIGERLVISVKTVSVHVSAILRKLGVASRTEAAVAVARHAGQD